ncbi:MAG: hypothetical protein DWP97_04985 [Calditrichaeota bacterium]|nr:MAG: hypothetical protein DWP97_04985 [Calditrichota bacterium]
MSASKYIPTGRTSLIKKDTVSLQVQTEYAYRPFPRLTTTILNSGQVLHKIEKKLEKEIESIAEQNIIEERIRSQHADVIKIIKENNTDSLLDSKKPAEPTPVVSEIHQDAVSEVAVSDAVVHETEIAAPPPAEEEIEESNEIHYTQRFKAIEGVKYVYHLTPDGQFHSEVESNQFKKTFSPIFKNIVEMMEIFAISPGGLEREKGVCEIQRNQLYLVSAGEKIYFVVLENPNKDINYEERFNQIINKYINLTL